MQDELIRFGILNIEDEFTRHLHLLSEVDIEAAVTFKLMIVLCEPFQWCK